MPEPVGGPTEGRELRAEDWYGEALGATVYVGCTFTEVDLTEATTSGARFDHFTFHRCRFNSSVHRTTAFVACDFRRCNVCDATFDGCKLTGSVFSQCTLRPIRIDGGQWRGVTIRDTNLAGLDLREADLS